MIFPNWAKNILFLLVFMISGLVLIIIIEDLLSSTELLTLNTAIEQIIAQIRTPLLTTLLVWVTRLGDPFVLSSATALICALLFARGRTYDAVLFGVAMIVAIISLIVLRNTFQISRPGSSLLEVEGWSFPSGHATVATAFFFLLILSFFRWMKTTVTKTLLVVGSILGVLLVCFSRLYLGAHWTLDILAGIALGLLSVSLTMLFFSVFVENRRSLKSRLES